MIDLTINTQPDDESCGPTCLHGIYRYYGISDNLDEVIQTIERSRSGGTLAPFLGKHALSHPELEATIYVNNLDVFDPSWFRNGASNPDELIKKLQLQTRYKTDPNIVQSCQAYQQFLEMGGVVRFETIHVHLLQHFFKQKIPVLTGLSATYLYRSSRECYTEDGICYYDDIQGTPCGHFVILCGYDETNRHIIVADPHRQNPISQNNYYKVSSRRLINAIMLGVLTYDANLLIVKPKNFSTTFKGAS